MIKDKHLMIGLAASITILVLLVATMMAQIQINKDSMRYGSGLELHLTADHYRNGVLLSSSYHAMSNTNYGKNWTANKITGFNNATWAYNATYIGCSNSTAAFDATWTALPSEITTSGLTRAAATMTYTGLGTWNATVTFTITATNSTRMYGYYIDSGASATLIAAEQQGDGNQKNVLEGDTLIVTIQGTTI